MSRLRWRGPAGGSGALAVALIALPGAAGAATWSPAAPLTRCPAATGASIVFPSADPHTSSGPGAIFWSDDPVGCATNGQPGSGIGTAAIGAGDVVDLAQPLPLGPGPPAALGGLSAAAGTGDGRIVLAARFGSGPAGPVGALEGTAGGTFGRPVALRARSAPLATATSYLGDVALVTVSAAGRVELRIQRHGAAGLSRPLVLTRPSTVTGLAVGLDYRGDALVVWAQDGWIYRRVLRASGQLETTERVAPSPPAPHLQALISDDNHGIVAWTSDVTSGAVTTTSAYLDPSRSGVHFGRPHLLERFRNPPGLRLPDGSLRLVRLASEGVMIAWTGSSGGRYVVRAASVSLIAPRPSRIISGPAGDAVLADMATGPHAEAFAVWTAAPRGVGGFDGRRAQILAARGVAEASGLVAFSAPEIVAAAGANARPRAAVDPTTDNPISVWQKLGGGIVYATRSVGGALRRGGPAAPVGARGGWSTSAWGLAALAALAGVGAGAGAWIRRSRRSVSGRRTRAIGRPPQAVDRRAVLEGAGTRGPLRASVSRSIARRRAGRER